jgi:hypothetical protein
MVFEGQSLGECVAWSPESSYRKVVSGARACLCGRFVQKGDSVGRDCSVCQNLLTSAMRRGAFKRMNRNRGGWF